MPTSQCKFPDHHGPSSGGPVTLLLAILAGAGIVAYARTVIVVLAVVAVLVVVAGAVMLLIHSAHAPAYDADLEPETCSTVRQVATALPAPAAAELHQHLHIHVATAQEASAILAAQAQPWQPLTGEQDYTDAAPRTFQPAALRGVQRYAAIEKRKS